MSKVCQTILVVEDDHLIRETLKSVLELEGYFVVTASNGKEAIAQLEKAERPCLILLDLMMPVMNGWEFLEKRQHSDVLLTIPVAIVTAATETAIEKAKGANEIIKKPIELEMLLTAVRNYCGAPPNAEGGAGAKP